MMNNLFKNDELQEIIDENVELSVIADKKYKIYEQIQ